MWSAQAAINWQPVLSACTPTLASPPLNLTLVEQESHLTLRLLFNKAGLRLLVLRSSPSGDIPDVIYSMPAMLVFSQFASTGGKPQIQKRSWCFGKGYRRNEE